MRDRKVLIIGASGVLGKYLVELFKNESSVLTPNRSELNIVDGKQVSDFFISQKPEIVIHVAAKTNVDECERNPQDAYAVNAEGTKYIANACSQHGAFLIYVSTAAVFDGKKTCFYEDDTPNPINVYGKSKLKGEKYIEEVLEDYMIVRTGWMVGGGMREKKFVSYILSQLKIKKEIAVVQDTRGSMTYAKELSGEIKQLLETNKKGIFHYASKGVCTRFDIAQKLVEMAKADVKLIPVDSSYFRESFSAPRLENEVIGSKKLEFTHTWQESLQAYFDFELKHLL